VLVIIIAYLNSVGVWLVSFISFSSNDIQQQKKEARMVSNRINRAYRRFKHGLTNTEMKTMHT
ncbi:MAG: hypothetical protein ACI90V_001925, partial [Bacillariaceae sp.]|jgi:hypothetical protein